MARRGSGLAARLREAMEREEGMRSTEEKERLERLERAREARTALFDDLAAVGTELGFASVKTDDQSVRISRADRWLEFAADGDADGVNIEYTGKEKDAENRLYREEALDGRWIWVRTRRGKEDRVPLFDQGLELLLVHALDLPSPDAGPAPSPQAARPSNEEGDTPDEPAPVKRTL